MVITVWLKASKHLLIVYKVISDAVKLCLEYTHILALSHKVQIKVSSVLHH